LTTIIFAYTKAPQILNGAFMKMKSFTTMTLSTLMLILTSSVMAQSHTINCLSNGPRGPQDGVDYYRCEGLKIPGQTMVLDCSQYNLDNSDNSGQRLELFIEGACSRVPMHGQYLNCFTDIQDGASLNFCSKVEYPRHINCFAKEGPFAPKNAKEKKLCRKVKGYQGPT
jgi:hypothetical protein